jgi:hypothetical protein
MKNYNLVIKLQEFVTTINPFYKTSYKHFFLLYIASVFSPYFEYGAVNKQIEKNALF